MAWASSSQPHTAHLAPGKGHVHSPITCAQGGAWGLCACAQAGKGHPTLDSCSLPRLVAPWPLIL